MCDFSILGRGKVGRALASAWGGRVRLLPNDAAPEGLVLLALPDRVLPEAAARFPGRCVHMSGSLSLPGVPCAHPLTSFDGRAENWTGTPLALEGELPSVLLRAFEGLGFVPFRLDPGQKALYHAAAVLASGHVATLWLGADRLLREAGIRLPGRGLQALAEATLRNVSVLGPEGRTGPFARGDEATVARDAAALPEDWRDVFLRLGRL